QRQASQGVVGAQFQDDDGGLMAVEQGGQAAGAAAGRVAADAGVHNPVVGVLFCHARGKQRHPPRAAGQAVLGRKAVAHYQQGAGCGTGRVIGGLSLGGGNGKGGGHGGGGKQTEK